MRFFLAIYSLLTAATLLVVGSAARSPTNLTLTGHITPDQIFSFVNTPSKALALNSLDLGIFDPHGVGATNSETGFSGSRGWSGGFRNNFTLSGWDATPGYSAGPLLLGTWNVVLGPYATNRSGIDWTLDISLSYDVPSDSVLWSPALAPIYKQTFPASSPSRWLRGDFHMHSIYSDGRYLPSEQIAHALEYNLDFIFFSEHNTDSGNNNIGRWIPANASNLLIGRAIEVTTRHGHWQAIGLERFQQVDWRHTNASNDTGYVDAATQVRNSGGIVSINHPFENCSRCDWTLDWEHNDAIEVWNGRFDDKDEMAIKFWQSELVKGKKITALRGSDAHSPPDINGLPTTVVKVEDEKSQLSIVEGVKRGRVYLVEGPGMKLDFGVVYAGGSKKADIGNIIARTDLDNNSYASFSATGFQGAKACFVTEVGYVKNVSIVNAQQIQHGVAAMEFIRVEVRNGSDILLGLTNPIYFS
ncbi:hypothetical protein H2200_001095 [Cladophialophora chaetospira]|uniref:PHP domain protein n=1 Tax=Cladophialophora chaetospira TaxID=386627 RepID=A0AA38XKB3_9EURO|nr:hypothetical protein H2200_001095 [Cladophialophora chaetospira]